MSFYFGINNQESGIDFFLTVGQNNFGNKIPENILKLEAEGREFAKIMRSLEQFVRPVKGQNNVW